MLEYIDNGIKKVSEIIDHLGDLAISLAGLITLLQLLIVIVKKNKK